jgi:hypothetical protein
MCVQCARDFANYLPKERLAGFTGDAFLDAAQQLECVQFRHGLALSVAFNYPRDGSSIPTASSTANRPSKGHSVERADIALFGVSSIDGQIWCRENRDNQDSCPPLCTAAEINSRRYR